MSALIAPEIKKQFFDDAGAPLSGGKLYVYEAGTTTPIATYTSEAADTSNTNPIILNARGETGGIFLNAGSYKFLLKDADDADIWSQDNITVRDLATEFDDLALTVTTINSSIAAEVEANRIVSGKKSSKSSQSNFLIPIGTTNQVKVLADDVNLVYIINGAQYTLIADLVASGLVGAPATNNTALINSAGLSGQNSSRTLGEFGTVIPIDTIGSEISALNGRVAAFKIDNGVGVEYFTARIDSTNNLLKSAQRGVFFGSTGAPIERVELTDNDTLTLMKLSFLYLTTDGTMLVSYTEPTYSSTEPTSPLDGNMWYDMNEEKWKRFNSTIFVELDVVPLGVCIQDENGDTVGARGVEFYATTGDANTVFCEYADTTSIRSKSRFNIINVYGNVLRYSDSALTWNIVTNLEDDQTEAASTDYYAYIKEDGDTVISQTPPYDRRGDLRGFYHSYETWRYVGKVTNNASSNFNNGTVKSSSEQIQENAAIGESRSAYLTLEQFQAQMSPNWVLEDGGSCVGSAYEAITGNSTVPDHRGCYPRGKNNGRSDGNEDPAGELNLGDFQGDAFQGHFHEPLSGNNGFSMFQTGGPYGTSATSSVGAANTTGGAVTDGVNGTPRTAPETRVKGVIKNYFIKIN